MSTTIEMITVTTMGEDGDMWLVIGTSDAHSADEAVRQHVEHEVGETLESLFDAEDLVELSFTYRGDWIWRSGLSRPVEDDLLLTPDRLDSHPDIPAGRYFYLFSGFLVTA